MRAILRSLMISRYMAVYRLAAGVYSGTPCSSSVHSFFPQHWQMVCLVILTLGASMSGCAMVGPDFQTPEVAVREAWLDAADSAVEAGSADNSEWWKYFNDPTLDTLIQKAYDQNLSLQRAGLRVYEARALLGLAAGNLYPQMQSVRGAADTVQWSKNAEPVANLPDPVRSLVNTSFETYRLGLDAAWELDFWGRFRRGVESADANLAAAIASYDDALVSLTGEVAIAYIMLRTLEERLAYTRSNVAIQQRSLEIADVRFRNGLVTELDVQLARSFLSVNKAVIPELKTGIRQSKLALSLLLGMPPSDLRHIVGEIGTIPSTPDTIAVGLPADLLRRRPDIRMKELEAVVQSARIGMAQADLYPSVRLIGSIGYAADSTGDVFNSDSFLGFGSIRFNWNFLNYGRLRNNVRMEDARFQQAVTAYQETVLSAAREVEDGLVTFLQARQEVSELRDAVEAARRSVELSETQYRDGLISYSLVLDSQRSLVLTEDQLTAARGKVARGLIATYKALGGGWQIREGAPLIPDEVKATMRERTNWGKLMEPAAVEPVPPEKRGTWRAPDM